MEKRQESLLPPVIRRLRALSFRFLLSLFQGVLPVFGRRRSVCFFDKIISISFVQNIKINNKKTRNMLHVSHMK